MTRLDLEVVRRGLAPSRARAAALVDDGRVLVDGVPVRRAAQQVSESCVVELRARADGRPEPVSRAGDKLRAALEAFDLEVTGRRCLDAGASTGGFTEVLLDAGASTVHAVDVGHDQLAAALRAHSAVVIHEGVNVRTLTPAVLGGTVDLTVADLSFISLALVLPALAACTDHELVLLVKPQFELERADLDGRGVVRDPERRREAVRRVVDAVPGSGFAVRGALRSPTPGRSGNLELLLWAARGRAAGLTAHQAAAAFDQPVPVLARA